MAFMIPGHIYVSRFSLGLVVMGGRDRFSIPVGGGVSSTRMRGVEANIYGLVESVGGIHW